MFDKIYPLVPKYLQPLYIRIGKYPVSHHRPHPHTKERKKTKKTELKSTKYNIILALSTSVHILATAGDFCTSLTYADPHYVELILIYMRFFNISLSSIWPYKAKCLPQNRITVDNCHLLGSSMKYDID